MRRSARGSIVAAVLLITMAIASPVLAAGESGYHNCTASGYPFTRGETTGTTSIVAPGVPGGRIYENGVHFVVRYAHKTTPGGGGWWSVGTNGLNRDWGTYAGCQI